MVFQSEFLSVLFISSLSLSGNTWCTLIKVNRGNVFANRRGIPACHSLRKKRIEEALLLHSKRLYRFYLFFSSGRHDDVKEQLVLFPLMSCRAPSLPIVKDITMLMPQRRTISFHQLRGVKPQFVYRNNIFFTMFSALKGFR